MRRRQLHESEASLRSLRRELKESKAALSNAKAVVPTDDKALASVKAELADMKTALAASEKATALSEQHTTKLKSGLKQSKKEAESAGRDNRRLKADLGQKAERLTANIEELAETTTELAILRSSKDAAESELTALQKQFDKVIQDTAAKTRAVEKMRSAITDMRDAVAEHREHAEDLREQLSAQAALHKSMEATVDTQLDEITILRADLLVAQEERDSEHNETDNLRLRLEQELARLVAAEESTGTLEQTCQNLRTQLLDKEAVALAAESQVAALERLAAEHAALTTALGEAESKGSALASEHTAKVASLETAAGELAEEVDHLLKESAEQKGLHATQQAGLQGEKDALEARVELLQKERGRLGAEHTRAVDAASAEHAAALAALRASVEEPRQLAREGQAGAFAEAGQPGGDVGAAGADAVARLEKDLADARAAADGYETELRHLAAERAALQESAASKDARIASLQGERTEAAAALATLQSDADASASLAAETKQRFAEECALLAAAKAGLEQELVALRKNLAQTEAAHTAGAGSLAEVGAEREALRAELAAAAVRASQDLDRQTKAALLQRQALKNTIEQLETVAAQDKSKLESLAQQRNALHEEVATLTGAVADKDKAIREKELELRSAASNAQAISRRTERDLGSQTSLVETQRSTIDELEHRVAGHEAAAKEQGSMRAALEAVASESAEHVGLLEKRLKSVKADVSALTSRLEDKAGEIARLQKLLGDKADAIMDLEQSKGELEEQLVSERTNQLLARASDLDEQIATLEMAGAKKHKAKIQDLLARRAEHVDALKEQFDKRAELLALNTSGDAEPGYAPGEGDYGEYGGGGGDAGADADEDTAGTFVSRQADATRLRKYIDDLVAEVFSQDEAMAMTVMNGLPRLQQDADIDQGQVDALSVAELTQLISTKEADIANLEVYIEQLLGRIVDHCPSMLETGDFLNGP